MGRRTWSTPSRRPFTRSWPGGGRGPPGSAAGDLAFHPRPLAACDPDFAVQQIDLMLRERYQHPNGQLPAYEWNFEDVNPPVHAWAALFNYRLNWESLGSDA